jgi:hypothetical protein
MQNMIQKVSGKSSFYLLPLFLLLSQLLTNSILLLDYFLF